MVYILIQVNCSIYTGYSLFWADTDDQAERILFDMGVTIDACSKKKQTIKVSWDETGTVCTVESCEMTIQGKLYGADEIEQLRDVLLDAFEVSENDIDETKKKEYQAIMSLEKSPQYAPAINIMMKKRWINHN